MLTLNLDLGLAGVFFLFLVIPLTLALPCGIIQYLISAKVKDRVVRRLLLLPLPTLGVFLLWLLSRNSLLDLEFFGWNLDLIYVAAALLSAFLGWLLGLWLRDN